MRVNVGKVESVPLKSGQSPALRTAEPRGSRRRPTTRTHPRAPRAPRATVPVGAATAVLLALALPALCGCGARGPAPALRTGVSPAVCALDGDSDASPATTGFIVARTGAAGTSGEGHADRDLDAELAWLADETGTALTPERTLATGALLLRAEEPLGGRRRVDLLCALERLASVGYAAPDEEATGSGPTSSPDSPR